MPDRPDEFVHAKLIGAVAGNQGWLLSGSANLSRAALTRAVGDGGNVEDPTMEGAVMSVRASDEEFSAAADAFEDLATKAENALASDDRCAAATRLPQNRP